MLSYHAGKSMGLSSWAWAGKLEVDGFLTAEEPVSIDDVLLPSAVLNPDGNADDQQDSMHLPLGPVLMRLSLQ